jgi:hypothetical protein
MLPTHTPSKNKSSKINSRRFPMLVDFSSSEIATNMTNHQDLASFYLIKTSYIRVNGDVENFTAGENSS